MNPEDEYLDILDWPTGQKTGGQVVRRVAHQEGVPHKAMHLWVYTWVEGQLRLLFQQRSFVKRNFPGQFGPTVGGHVAAGEGQEALVREAWEEIGLKVGLKEMSYLGYNPFHFSLPGGYEDFEWIEDWRCVSAQRLEDYRFRDGEVIGLAMVNPGDLIRAKGEAIAAQLFDGNSLSEVLIKPNQWVEGLFDSPIFGRLLKEE
ncbi:MAG: hypothetical protein A2508_04085 [Candidatus Lambdaproteobacteria bacterium RIFOXYD12_FULL_49_8]|nr:MAG: hypothetical protein A2508_04085 [Candidatus Lambdaproteobacteria bacterium RIFOXYD12_FULL_49_8]